MLSGSSAELTCIVPTHNRPHFLRRLFTFWAATPAQGKTLIVDSSTGNLKRETEHVVHRFSEELPLHYEHLELGVIDKMAAALERVNTPYVYFCADDDFVFPLAVTENLEFLAARPDYVCAQGMIVSVQSLSFSNKRPKIMRGYDLASPSAAHRFRQMAHYWYSTFYATYRTRALRECFRIALLGPHYNTARIYPELVLSQMTVLLGKVKFFPRIYGVWQYHELNEHRQIHAVQELSEGEKHYRHFRDVLGEQLQRYSDLDKEACARFIDKYFASWIHGRGASKKLTAKLRAEVSRGVRRMVSRLRGDVLLEYRRITPRSALWQDASWQLAYHLIQKFPEGIPVDQS